MRFVVCYDIADDARRRRVADVLDVHGDRVQKSVFKIAASAQLFQTCLEEIKRCLNPEEDRLAAFSLCSSCDLNAICIGASAAEPRTGEETIFLV